tara:strand:- start:3790 stop:4725 length:936 start_codon:yes stop_codon:yes gene_type:complete
MNTLLFPGQGSQVVGMGKQFYDEFNIVKKIFDEADEKLKFKLSNIILEGPADQLQLTKNTQPAILVVSYSIFKVLREEFNFDLKKFKFFAGHSLGEYSALVCSESLNFSDAVYLLHERGKAMQQAVPIGKGSMIAVLGLNINEIRALLDKRDDKKLICEIANDNADGQIILSGEKSGIDKFQQTLQKNKVKSIPLKVSAPFHCSLMKPAAKSMKEKIESTNFKDPMVKIINNVTASAENRSEIIKKLLVDQIFSTVKWRESLINMSNNGIKNYIEIGPGKVLTGMVKRTIKNSVCFSINSIDDINKFINES